MKNTKLVILFILVAMLCSSQIMVFARDASIESFQKEFINPSPSVPYNVLSSIDSNIVGSTLACNQDNTGIGRTYIDAPNTQFIATVGNDAFGNFLKISPVDGATYTWTPYRINATVNAAGYTEAHGSNGGDKVGHQFDFCLFKPTDEEKQVIFTDPSKKTTFTRCNIGKYLSTHSDDTCVTTRILGDSDLFNQNKYKLQAYVNNEDTAELEFEKWYTMRIIVRRSPAVATIVIWDFEGNEVAEMETSNYQSVLNEEYGLSTSLDIIGRKEYEIGVKNVYTFKEVLETTDPIVTVNSETAEITATVNVGHSSTASQSYFDSAKIVSPALVLILYGPDNTMEKMEMVTVEDLVTRSARNEPIDFKTLKVTIPGNEKYSTAKAFLWNTFDGMVSLKSQASLDLK